MARINALRAVLKTIVGFVKPLSCDRWRHVSHARIMRPNRAQRINHPADFQLFINNYYYCQTMVTNELEI